MTDRWITLRLNPEPWAIGDVSAGRRGGRLTGTISPNPNLVAYQNAVREALEDVAPLPGDYRRLEFFFARQQAKYLDAADRVRQRNQADATNLQKGLEDALQGRLFDNDREIQDIRSVICQQGPHVEPWIAIRAMRSPVALPGMDEIPRDVLEQLLEAESPTPVNRNEWDTGGDLF